MDRYWLLTWTTYGTWLPGDARGSVANVFDDDAVRRRHNRVGEEYASPQPRLVAYIKQRLKQQPVWLRSDQAQAVLAQLRETAQHRGWQTCGAAVMSNHVHVVLGVLGDPDPEKLLIDLRAYATRTLNKWRRQTWWTTSGSKRKLPDDQAVLGGVRYVESQPGKLALYIDASFTTGDP